VGRKSYEGTGVLPGMEEEAQPVAPRTASRKSSSKPARTSKFITPRLIGTFVVALIGLGAALYAFHVAEQFVILDPRFALGGLEDDSALQMIGATHVSRAAIEKIFGDDEGVSIYLVPLAERRDALRNIAWIQDASVARVWPNRLVVRVKERTPIAFIRLNSSRFGLIDGEGVILPPATDRFKLPVLTGVKASDPIANRRAGVQRLLRLAAELGDSMANISEVDVSDGDNLKVIQPYEGRSLTLLLGDRNFAARYGNFVSHYAQIEQRLPGAAILDLRLEDRITVAE